MKKLVAYRGFAEMCFDAANRIIGKGEWNEHCEEQVQSLVTLTAQSHSVVTGYTAELLHFSDTAHPVLTRQNCLPYGGCVDSLTNLNVECR